MINNKDNVEKKESIWYKIKKILFTVPKGVKYAIFLIILLVIIDLGVLNNSNFTSQTKTTKLGFEDVGELVTQTGFLTIIVDNEDHRDFFNLFKIPFTESRQIFSYDLEIDAAVDFSKISYSINEKNNEIIVRIPHSKIYKSTLKTDSLKVYLDTGNIFSRIDLNEHNNALQEMEQQGIDTAKENGILAAADSNAKRLIEGFIKGNNKLKEYKIIYEYIED